MSGLHSEPVCVTLRTSVKPGSGSAHLVGWLRIEMAKCKVLGRQEEISVNLWAPDLPLRGNSYVVTNTATMVSHWQVPWLPQCPTFQVYKI